MSSIGDSGMPGCQGPTRRQWLYVGGLSAAGLLLPDLLRSDQLATGQAVAGTGGVAEDAEHGESPRTRVGYK